MKKLAKIFILLFFSSSLLVSCNGLLDVDSERIVFDNEYNMKSANDTLYSMFGIFTQLEKISNSYVLLGELRGDLMDLNSTASPYLKEINNFQISEKNPYANNIKDYYAVINNCNYLINTIDTSVVKGGIKVMYREYAAAKAIRAWTYMQIALNYETVTYYEKPILTVADAQKEYPVYTLSELAPILIQDLTPWKTVSRPNFKTIYSHDMANSFFPIRFVLGDLYLWLGQYENAANEYHDLMYNHRYTITTAYQSKRYVTNGVFNNSILINWEMAFSAGSSEYITSIAASNEFGQKFELDSLNLNHIIVPSKIAKHNWDVQRYFHSLALDTIGDLRKIGSWARTSIVKNGVNVYSDSIIVKLYQMNENTNKQIMPYRVALLYLRYAEAVNRIGKPNLALAVLKNGLSKATFLNRKAIPTHEATLPLPNYMNFNDPRFDLNIGVRMRGCGNVNQDTVKYIIPALATNTDSVLYVEDMIQKELALETACEGNRFHDLMRIAIRRNDNYYLADKVAAKHKDNYTIIRDKLSSRENWYLKK